MATIINPKTLKGFIAFFSLVLLISLEATAQNEVAIGSATTKSNAILWLNGNKSQGLILPYVTSKSAVSGPDKGMIVYDESDNKVWYRNDNAWVEVGGSAGGGAQSLNLQLTGNQLQLRDGTTTLSTVNIAGGTQTNGGFMVFTGGSWQYAALSGDVTGTNGALLVDGIKGKTLPALPTTTQALVYDGTAWKFQTLTVGTDSQDLSLNSATNTLSLTNDDTPVDLTPYKQNLTLTGTTLGISGGNTVTLPASGSGTVTSVSAGNGLAGGTITTAGTISIASGGVGATELADNAVTNTKIASGANIDISKLNGGAANNNKVLKVIGGVVTYADDEIGGTGDITDVIAGTGLTGGATTGAATLSLSNTGVVAGTYGTTTEIPRITVDAQGRVSGVTTVAPSVADGSITGGTAGPGVKIAASTITDANILSLNAGKITAGTLPVAQVPNLDASKITTGIFTAARIPNLDASKITTGTFATTQIPDLDAAKITSGVIPTTQGGTGLSFSSGSINNGQLLIGSGGAFVKANLTQGNGITITNGAGTVSIATSGNFGSQNLSTSGTLNAGATTVSGLTIGTSAWPANAPGVLTNNGSGTLSWAPAGGGGTVTSVGLAMPAIFTVANSPVTTSGTLTATLASQPAATIFAAPAAAAGAPAFRALAATDIPNLDAAKINTGTLPVVRGGTGLTAAPGNGQLMIGNGTGYTLSTLAGGTGVNIANAAGTITISTTGLINPMTTPGDIIYGGAAGAATRLATGTGFLKGGAIPSYTAVDLATTDVSGVLPLTNGGTGSNTAAGARTSLGLGSLATLNAVTSTEITDGTITNIDILNVDAAKITTGTLPVARGGTNSIATPTNGGVSYGTGTAYAFTPAGTSGQLLQSNGAAAPSWVNPFTNPMTMQGDIIVGGVSGVANRLPSPGAGRAILGYNGTIPTWVSGSPNQLLGTDGAGELGFINQSGFLNIASTAGGDLTGTFSNLQLAPLAIVNADIATLAAIEGTKVNPDFGPQNISTTGTLTISGATTLTTLGGSGSQMVVVDNDGLLSKQALPSGFSTLNIIPKGNGTTLIDSQIFDDGTNVGIGTTTPASTLHAASLGNRIVLVDGSNAIGTWYEMRNTSAGGQIFGIISTGSGNGEGAGKLLFTKNNTLGSTAGNFMTFDWATANVGIGNSSPTARLDIAGSIKITDGTQATGRVLTSDANGLASWQPAGAGSGWTLIGNGGTNATTNFIGTTDNIALNFRVNNVAAGRIDPALLNTFFGQNSGRLAATGANNIGYGYNSLSALTSGVENTALGYKALESNTASSLNTAVGKSALFSMAFANGGTAYNSANTAVGYHSLYSTNPSTTSNGARNTAIGYFAGFENTTGTNNVFIGYGAGPTVGTLTNATAIGYNAKVAASNAIILGGTGADGVNVAIGTTTPSAFPLTIQRFGGNTGLIWFNDAAGVFQGSITLSGTTVSYNAFTGSHIGSLVDGDELLMGTLITMTGEMVRSNGDESEPIYQVKESIVANDPKILGTYNGKEDGLKNASLIMAAGNGEVWVVDNGSDLEVGDFLISSEIKGHAMKEDGTFEVAHVFAKVAERVKWSEVTESFQGRKHKRISVLFETFVRNNKAESLSIDLENTKKEVELLRKEMETIKSILGIEAKNTIQKKD